MAVEEVTTTGGERGRMRRGEGVEKRECVRIRERKVNDLIQNRVQSTQYKVVKERKKT